MVNGIRLLGWRRRPDEWVGAGINSILFWGVICAVLGFLGQWTGIYKSITVAASAEKINSRAVAQGFADSLQTTMLGLGILLIAALLWLALSSYKRRLEAPPRGFIPNS